VTQASRLRDFIIIGGGIVGAAVAWQLQQRHPQRRILLLEKDEEFGRGQTGHNSGVIHAGVYYEPGSLKARFCREGLRETMEFCRQEGIPCEQRGKLLVATSAVELERMEALQRRCQDNGVEARRLEAEELQAREPGINGLGALHVPESGITDYREICLRMLERFTAMGGECRAGVEVTAIRENDRGVEVTTRGGGRHGCRFLIACAGTMSDRVARMHGIRPDWRIVPVRGDFYRLAPGRGELVRHLIYPIPDPALPFVGVHLTPLIGGGILVGPNAVPAWSRAGTGVSLRDLSGLLAFGGWWRLAGRHWRAGLSGMASSWSKRLYLRLVRKYCPAVGAGDLLPHPPGIRAQAVARDGTLVNDFLFATTPKSLHVCSAPSPAATSAIPIGRHVSAQIGSI
jgi:L-2-hydroxyglutarate oxidase